MSKSTRRQTFVNKETGEEIHAHVNIARCGQEDFDIIYIMNFGNLFDLFGGKKYRILKYLLQNRNAENQVIATTSELAESSGVSRSTVIATLKVLKECGIITTKTGVIMINPQVIAHGNAKKEDWIFTKFVASAQSAPLRASRRV